MMFWDGIKALVHKLSIPLSREENCFKYFLLKTSAAQEKEYVQVMAQGECWSQWTHESSHSYSSFL